MSGEVIFDGAAVQRLIGLRFEDEELLQEAMTHRSFLNENPDLPLQDNERLEFLGDAVLGFLVGAYLFGRFPDAREGDLTFMRARLVRATTLATFMRQIELAPHILLGHGEELGGGRERDALLSDVFEALLGAIYLDQGLTRARAWLIENFVAGAVDEIVAGDGHHKDAKSRFQEEIQALLGVTPVYELIEESGPDHDKEFRMQVRVADTVWGTGTGSNKQSATQAAARDGLRRLELEK